MSTTNGMGKESMQFMDQKMPEPLSETLTKEKPKKPEGKIYCANCMNCVMIKVPTGINNQYVLRVKCKEKKWRKKLGEEKVYKYFTVARRTTDYCDAYEPMGELKSYLKDLRKSLPIKDEIYKG